MQSRVDVIRSAVWLCIMLTAWIRPVLAQQNTGAAGALQTPPPQPTTPPANTGGGGDTANAGSMTIVDLHGPDGLPFTVDDPLRVATATHNGVFAISYNAVSAFPAERHANIPAVPPLVPKTPQEKAELMFLDLTNYTISRHNLSFSSDPDDKWDEPIPLDAKPGIFVEGEDYLAGGSALRHEIVGGPLKSSKERNISREADAAIIIDPRMMKPPKEATGKCPGTGGMIAKITEQGIDYAMLERFAIDKAQVFALLKVSGEFETEFAFSFRVRIGEIWAKLANNLFGGLIKLGVGLLGGAIGSMIGMPIKVTDGYLHMPVEDITKVEDVPAEVSQAVADKIAEKPSLSGKVTAQQILEAAVSNSDCASIGVKDENLCADEVKPLIDATKGTLKSLVAGPKLIQGIVDCIAKYVDLQPKPIYGWIGFKNPKDVDEKTKSLAQRVIKVGLDTELNKCLYPPDQINLEQGVRRPNLSASYLFDSSFLYGPKGKWIVQRDANAEPGLVEEYLYIRLNLLNPFDIEGPEEKRTAGWTQLDFITEKPVKTPPPRVPWPPIGKYVTGETNDKTWGGGTCQIIGDEAANGTEDSLPPTPDQCSTMAMVVNPDETTGRLHIAFTVRSAYKGSPKGKEIIWANYPPRTGLPTVSLPPTYREAGQGARAFRIAVGNLNMGKVPGGYEYNWDFNGDTQIDSWFGNTVRKISQVGNVAVCYVVNPATGQTGVGMKRVE
jgi:hypothetical protein